MGVKKQSYKEVAIQVATELGYDDDIVTRIKNANNDNDIERIMCQARENMTYGK